MGVQLFANVRVLGELSLDRFHAALVGRTLLYNGIVAALATGFAIPAALMVGRGRGWATRVLTAVLPLPLLFPSITYAYGWSQALRLADLWVGRPLHALAQRLPATGFPR